MGSGEGHGGCKWAPGDQGKAIEGAGQGFGGQGMAFELAGTDLRGNGEAIEGSTWVVRRRWLRVHVINMGTCNAGS